MNYLVILLLLFFAQPASAFDKGKDHATSELKRLNKVPSRHRRDCKTGKEVKTKLKIYEHILIWEGVGALNDYVIRLYASSNRTYMLVRVYASGRICIDDAGHSIRMFGNLSNSTASLFRSKK